jgi:hypothetical protein
MRRIILCLILIADAVVCPYACSGSLLTTACTDSCCPAKDADSDSDEPASPPDSCDGSCANCLCGGAVPIDETLTHVTPHLSVDALLPIESNLDHVTARLALHFEQHGTGDLRAGVTLRALLQSFLL